MAVLDSGLRIKAVRLIETHFGSSAAKMYEDFYKDKDDATIRESVTLLLGELLGENKAIEQVDIYLK